MPTETIQNPRKVGEVWDNKSGPRGAGNTAEGLTHSSDYGREGLLVKSTRTLDDTTFWNHVDQDESGCWLWTAATTPTGYGQFRFHDGSRAAHRLAYEHLVGPIPDGLELDHLCRVRNCVRPEHLEPVTHAENLRRRVLVRKGGQFHCGFTEHPRTPENTRLKRRAGGDVEQCLTCERARATAKVTCPLCGRKSSAGNLAEHQRTAICQSIREERTP